VNGPAIELDSSQVQNLALAFHELTTNSLKYGALAVEGGWIDLHWWIDQTPDGPVARLEWQEIGGPPVTPPERTGFGRMMVETLLPHSLGGSAQLDFAPDGLVWRLDMPLR
jgi:two-component sensor histidine kinase